MLVTYPSFPVDFNHLGNVLEVQSRTSLMMGYVSSHSAPMFRASGQINSWKQLEDS